MKIIDIVRDNNMAYFSHYCGGNLYYTVNVDNNIYLFNINTDTEEVGTAIFPNEIKALTLMRWINICLKNEEFIKIK